MTTVDLVGPKGYKHGFIYVGGPGLPSSPPARSHHAGSGRRSARHVHPRTAPPASSTEPPRMQGMIEGRQVHKTVKISPGPYSSGRFRDAERGVDMGGHKPESAEGRRRALAAGHALPPAHPGGQPGYPVTDGRHWDKALQSVGRSGGGARRTALARLLKKTAPEFGRSIKGTWVEKELAGASLSNVLQFSDSFIPNPSKEQWAVIDARRGGDHDENQADRHIGAARSSFQNGQHGAALTHLQQAHALTSDPAKKTQIENLHKRLAGTALQAGTIKAMSNGSRAVTASETYDLAARFSALGFASTDETADYGSDSAAMHTVSHDHDGYGEHTHNFSDDHGYGHDNVMPKSGRRSSGEASLPRSPEALRTPAPRPTSGFSPGSSGLQVRSRGGQYGSEHSNGAGRGIELARRQVASASDIVVSRGEGGSAVIRHRRGGDTIGTIARQADGKWGGKLEGGKELQAHTHQRAALQELIGTWNTGQVSPYRPAMPLQQAPVTPPLLQQLGATNVRLATPATGAQSGPRVTMYANGGDGGSDSDSDDSSGPAGLSPKGVSIYKKLIARKFPPARALAFARRAQNFGQ